MCRGGDFNMFLTALLYVSMWCRGGDFNVIIPCVFQCHNT